ncbi:tagaturonate reductase [Sediminibacterium soli]|uniref:tagaturonate reductase n=1 Tax=Sediminibacterium soli TaxID=2698829 RepID=UPI00137B6195|nr:tagaturonate reductase [Sediminibacterium soli]NCI47364.1 tagaturonate reductase [Sediminibacterium soli]
MQLSKKTISQAADKHGYTEQVANLPERVLQFGTGVLLRGLPDYFIDKANKENLFNGRIVVVKSTANGGTDAFKLQDGMFTLLERGIQDGIKVDRQVLNTAISRVLSAADEWNEILACAANPLLQLVISNTTEVGIVLVESDAASAVPVSFPGRLLAFLEARYRVFNGSDESGMVIVPAELIVDNGTKLKEIVTTLARLKGHTDAFMNWLEQSNDFCNSLVDCIVPGKLSADEHRRREQELGYEDELMIMSEPYRLWAIETASDRARSVLSFSEANKDIVITPDINKFRELKLRLLNGTHTFSCALAFLSGFSTVKQAMNDAGFTRFVSSLMLQEIAPLVVQETISLSEAHAFAEQVLDRFRNPYIEHQWISISAQYTSKMAMRCVPLIDKHYSVNHEPPALMALGFAAYLLFTRPAENSGGQYTGNDGTKKYPINDDKATALYAHWQSAPDTEACVYAILKDEQLFGKDLTRYKGFPQAVLQYLALLTKGGVSNALHSGILKQTIA